MAAGDSSSSSAAEGAVGEERSAEMAVWAPLRRLCAWLLPRKRALRTERRRPLRRRESADGRPPPEDPRRGEGLTPEALRPMVGETALQLDRRILSRILPGRSLIYGVTLSGIAHRIAQGGNDPMAPLTEEEDKDMMDRFTDLMDQLRPLGYDPNIHPMFSEYIVNTYGIIRDLPDALWERESFNNYKFLRCVINAVVPKEKVEDCRVLLSCLSHLSQADGKPLLIW